MIWIISALTEFHQARGRNLSLVAAASLVSFCFIVIVLVGWYSLSFFYTAIQRIYCRLIKISLPTTTLSYQIFHTKTSAASVCFVSFLWASLSRAWSLARGFGAIFRSAKRRNLDQIVINVTLHRNLATFINFEFIYLDITFLLLDSVCISAMKSKKRHRNTTTTTKNKFISSISDN